MVSENGMGVYRHLRVRATFHNDSAGTSFFVLAPENRPSRHDCPGRLWMRGVILGAIFHPPRCNFTTQYRHCVCSAFSRVGCDACWTLERSARSKEPGKL